MFSLEAVNFLKKPVDPGNSVPTFTQKLPSELDLKLVINKSGAPENTDLFIFDAKLTDKENDQIRMKISGFEDFSEKKG